MPTDRLDVRFGAGWLMRDVAIATARIKTWSKHKMPTDREITIADEGERLPEVRRYDRDALVEEMLATEIKHDPRPMSVRELLEWGCERYSDDGNERAAMATRVMSAALAVAERHFAGQIETFYEQKVEEARRQEREACAKVDCNSAAESADDSVTAARCRYAGSISDQIAAALLARGEEER